jgi:hypothetical protein
MSAKWVREKNRNNRRYSRDDAERRKPFLKLTTIVIAQNPVYRLTSATDYFLGAFDPCDAARIVIPNDFASPSGQHRFSVI